MKNYKIILFLGLLFCCVVFPFPVFSQHAEELKQENISASEFDQLIPQQFAFDKEHDIFTAINIVDNTIDIIKHDETGLHVINKTLVDKFEGRHDLYHVYRPQGVAVYEGYIVYLASHRDSSYFAVLDLEGNLVKKCGFSGNASAFSYSPSKHELYIAGQNGFGYDVIVLETSNGIESIDLQFASALHYLKPKKSEEMAFRDPKGIGITMIAMSVVFLALLMLTIVFTAYGKSLVSVQGIREKLFTKKYKEVTGEELNIVKPGKVSGEEFAAISAAIYLFYNELHDEENTQLTIKKVQRAWTPWNAKLYSMNQYFNKR